MISTYKLHYHAKTKTVKQEKDIERNGFLPISQYQRHVRIQDMV